MSADAFEQDLVTPEEVVFVCLECNEPREFQDDEPNVRVKNFDFATRTWEDTGHVCVECVSYCDKCSEFWHWRQHGTRMWNVHTVNDWCADCSSDYHVCNDCGEAEHSDNIAWVDGDTSYCHDCVNAVASYCDSCDEWHSEPQDCSDYREDSSLVRGYGYKPSPSFYSVTGQEPTDLYMGIELEVESARGNYSDGAEIADRLNDTGTTKFYLKTDSSLNFGFEIVSHPMTLEYWNEGVRWQTLDELRQIGFRSWDVDTCGIHVHVSRKAFKNRAHLFAFTLLINRNPSLMRKIAGRNSSYGEISSDSRENNKRVLKQRYHAGQGGNRYNAVNLQNEHTVEIRMFKGSLKVERVRSDLEFVHAAVTYTADVNSGADAKRMLDGVEFCSWVRKSGKYPNLVQYLPSFETLSNGDNE